MSISSLALEINTDYDKIDAVSTENSKVTMTENSKITMTENSKITMTENSKVTMTENLKESLSAGGARNIATGPFIRSTPDESVSPSTSYSKLVVPNTSTNPPQKISINLHTAVPKLVEQKHAAATQEKATSNADQHVLFEEAENQKHRHDTRKKVTIALKEYSSLATTSTRTLHSSTQSKGKFVVELAASSSHVLEKRITHSSTKNMKIEPNTKTFKEIIANIIAQPPDKWLNLSQDAIQNLPPRSSRNLFINRIRAAALERAETEATRAMEMKAIASVDLHGNPWWLYFHIKKAAEVLKQYPQHLAVLKVEAEKTEHYHELCEFYEEIATDPEAELLGLRELMAEDDRQQIEMDKQTGGRENGRCTMRESLLAMEWYFTHQYEELCNQYCELLTLPALAKIVPEAVEKAEQA